MPDLEFACLGADADRFAIGPTINVHVRITETTGASIHGLALRCQLRVEPVRRGYNDDEGVRLSDLFGERSRWGDTLKPLQFAFVSLMVPGFTDSTDVVLQIPCSYDVDVAAHKYLYALEQGTVPLLLLFSGTIFTTGPAGIAVFPVPWHKEARLDLPVAVWRSAMEQHFPGTAWLRLSRERFDALYLYRSRHGLTGWDDTVDRLLKEADE